MSAKFFRTVTTEEQQNIDKLPSQHNSDHLVNYGGMNGRAASIAVSSSYVKHVPACGSVNEKVKEGAVLRRASHSDMQFDRSSWELDKDETTFANHLSRTFRSGLRKSFRIVKKAPLSSNDHFDDIVAAPPVQRKTVTKKTSWADEKGMNIVTMQVPSVDWFGKLIRKDDGTPTPFAGFMDALTAGIAVTITTSGVLKLKQKCILYSDDYGFSLCWVRASKKNKFSTMMKAAKDSPRVPFRCMYDVSANILPPKSSFLSMTSLSRSAHGKRLDNSDTTAPITDSGDDEEEEDRDLEFTSAMGRESLQSIRRSSTPTGRPIISPVTSRTAGCKLKWRLSEDYPKRKVVIQAADESLQLLDNLLTLWDFYAHSDVAFPGGRKVIEELLAAHGPDPDSW